MDVGPHTVQARVGRAVVDFLLAVEAGVSRGALAEIASLGVVGTTPAVEARPVGTSHGAELAVVAVETGGTCALVGAVKVLKARKANDVTTKVCYLDVLLFPNAALVSPPLPDPRPPPLIIFHTTTYSAAASVATGASRTFIDLDLTAGPCEARGTGAGVAALAGVGAGSSVEARFVVGTVIQIWNQRPAEKTT